MTRNVLVTLVSLLTLGACRDARPLPTAANPAASKSTLGSSTSTVCNGYRRKLHLMTAHNLRAPTVDLEKRIVSLATVVADACN